MTIHEEVADRAAELSGIPREQIAGRRTYKNGDQLTTGLDWAGMSKVIHYSALANLKHLVIIPDEGLREFLKCNEPIRRLPTTKAVGIDAGFFHITALCQIPGTLYYENPKL